MGNYVQDWNRFLHIINLSCDLVSSKIKVACRKNNFSMVYHEHIFNQTSVGITHMFFSNATFTNEESSEYSPYSLLPNTIEYFFNAVCSG